MKLQIGERIKALRRKKGVTQEQLAEMLNVSCQSVSRWEIGACYPDIELLPVIAGYFGTTTDFLMGMDEVRSSEKRREIFTKALDMERCGDWTGAVNILRDAVRDFPGDDGFASELALALSRTENRAGTAEAIDLSERILSRLTQDKLRSTVRANLCFLYKKAGLSEKALAMAYTLPHIWESREMVMPEIVADNKREKTAARSLNIARQVISDVVQQKDILFSLGYDQKEGLDISDLTHI